MQLVSLSTHIYEIQGPSIVSFLSFIQVLPLPHRIPGWCWLEGTLKLICHGQGWHWEMKLIRASSNLSPHPKGCSWFLQDTQRKGFHWATAAPPTALTCITKKIPECFQLEGTHKGQTVKPRGKDCYPSRAALRRCWKRIWAFRA